MRPVPVSVSRYSPYGYKMNAAGGRLAFNGERRDPCTGCYHLGNGYRAYNPKLMRFQSADRLSPFGEGGVNAYAYCLGDPVNHYDPSGEKAEDYVLPILGILTNLVGVFISGLRFRSLHKQGAAFRRTALEPLAPSIPLPTRKDWVLSSISALSGAAGLTIGVARTVEPENTWQTWALAALTTISLGTSAFEAWGLAQAKPWQSSSPQALFPLSPLRRSQSLSTTASEVRDT